MREKLWVLLLLCCLCVATCGFAVEEPASDDAFAGVEVLWNEQTAGSSNILEPSITGLVDAEVQTEINAKIVEKLPMETLRIALDRAASWGEEDMGDAGLTMMGTTFRQQNLLSITLSVRGLLDEESMVRHRYYAMNFDLLTGQEITFADLFQNPDAAAASMETIIETVFAEEDINTYLENAQVLPMPRDNFSLDANGMTVYYPASQYSNISGTAGAFRFLYYELEPLLAVNNAMTELLSASLTLPEDTAESILQDMSAGQLPGIPVQLGIPLLDYDTAYHVVAEPDYTLSERLYQFEAPQLERAWLGTPLYLDEGVTETVDSIRTTHIDLCGLRPGTSRLSDVVDLLGEPDDIQEVDENRGFNSLLPEGQSYRYHHEGKSLIFHGDAEGGLYCIILEVQGASDALL